MKLDRLLELFGEKLREKFIEDICFGDNKRDNVMIIEHNNKEKDDKLKEVVIEDIPFESNDYQLYYFGFLEQEDAKDLKGISSAGKTVDAILTVFDKENKKLDVYLIELKTELDNKILGEIQEKLEQSIFRLFLFLPHLEPKISSLHDTILESEINFYGIVFYNGKNKCESRNLPRNITQLFNSLSDNKGFVAFNLPLGAKVQGQVKFISAENDIVEYDKDSCSITIIFDNLIDFS